MTTIQIVAIIAAVLLYIITILALSYKFGEETPVWLDFISLPFDLVGLILFFPLVIYQKKKLNDEYNNAIKAFRK